MPTTTTHPELLVIGATGTTGSAVIRALIARDTACRAMSRRADAELPGRAELVVGDVARESDLARALDGIRAVYLVTPSTDSAEEQQLRVLKAAEEAGVSHLVLLSQYAAAQDSPVRFLRYHAAVEQALADSRIAATVLRPNLFMHGLLMFKDLIATQGIITAPIADAKVSAVHVDDIGEVAAHALIGGDALGTVTLTGPEALTHQEMAAMLAKACQRRIEFVDSSTAQFREALTGVPEWQVDGLIEDYAHYRAGEAADVTDDFQRVIGKPSRSFATFANEVAPLLQG
jgi:uncharacterized protein YbjT (DUF2867 family)